MDVFEFYEHDNRYEASVHWWNNGHDTWFREVVTNENLSNDMHLYSMEYDPFTIKFYLDNVQVAVMSKYITLSGTPVTWCDVNQGTYLLNAEFPLYGTPLRVIANVALLNEQAEDKEVSPSTMEIDYIKVYERCGGNSSLSVEDYTTQTITGNLDYTNIKVGTGATLNIIDAEIRISNWGKIDVRKDGNLNVINSRLTSATCDGKWKGIESGRYWGTGKISIKDSRIDFAKNAVQIYGKSELVLDSVFISHCDIGLDLRRSDSNKKVFNNTRFVHNNISIYSLNSTNLEVEDSEFYYGQNEHIRAYDSNIDIKGGNLFQGSSDYSIALEGTYPLATGLNIGLEDNTSNVFLDCKNGIFSSGAESPNGMNIINNQFNVDNTAVKFYGYNQVNFANNEVTIAEWGSVFQNTGDNFNDTKCNQFNSVEKVENAFVDYNIQTTFLQNYSQGVNNTSVRLYNAYIKNKIGSEENPAGNCFSTLSNFDFKTSSIWGDNGGSFHYYFNNDLTVCSTQEPFNPDNYTKEERDEKPNNCTNIGIFNLIDPDGDGQLGVDKDNDPYDACFNCIKDSIEAWVVIVRNDTTIVDTSNNGGGESSVSDPHTDGTDTEAILDQWINYGLYIALETNNYQFAEEILVPLTSWRWQKRLYGVKIIQKDFIEADQILQSMPESTQDQIYFKEVQFINMKRFNEFRDGYKITQSDIDKLRIVAESRYPSCGYAYSLLHILTGEEIDITDLPYDTDHGSMQKMNIGQQSINNQIQGVVIYPNPVVNIVNVEIMAINSKSTISIYSIEGKKVISKSPKSQYSSIDISELRSGLYFISIIDAYGKQYNRKIIVE